MSTSTGVSTLDQRMTAVEQRMTAMEVAFARVETKLDELVRQSEPRGADVEARLRALERARWWAAGAGAALGAMAGYLTQVLPH